MFLYKSWLSFLCQSKFRAIQREQEASGPLRTHGDLCTHIYCMHMHTRTHATVSNTPLCWQCFNDPLTNYVTSWLQSPSGLCVCVGNNELSTWRHDCVFWRNVVCQCADNQQHLLLDRYIKPCEIKAVWCIHQWLLSYYFQTSNPDSSTNI